MTSFDLRLILCVSLAMLGLACVGSAWRILTRGAAVSALFFSGLGGLLMVAIGMMTLGHGRLDEPSVFPVAVRDLNAQPAIERIDDQTPATTSPDPAGN
jgi:hypothetical protein